jgi:hypothetical protein
VRTPGVDRAGLGVLVTLVAVVFFVVLGAQQPAHASHPAGALPTRQVTGLDSMGNLSAADRLGARR